jgi:hypothetical protein
MGHPLKKESGGSLLDSEAVRQASRRVSRTIDSLTDKISRDIGHEVINKEETDSASQDE